MGSERERHVWATRAVWEGVVDVGACLLEHLLGRHFGNVGAVDAHLVRLVRRVVREHGALACVGERAAASPSVRGSSSQSAAAAVAQRRWQQPWVSGSGGAAGVVREREWSGRGAVHSLLVPSERVTTSGQPSAYRGGLAATSSAVALLIMCSGEAFVSVEPMPPRPTCAAREEREKNKSAARREIK